MAHAPPLPPTTAGGLSAALKTDFFLTSVEEFLELTDGVKLLNIAEQSLTKVPGPPLSFFPLPEFLHQAMARALLPAGIAAPPSSSLHFASANTQVVPAHYVTRPLLTGLASLLSTVPAESSREALQPNLRKIDDTEVATFAAKESAIDGFASLEVTLPCQPCKSKCENVILWKCAAGDHVSNECRQHSFQCLSCRGHVCIECVVGMPADDEMEGEAWPYTAKEYCSACAFWCPGCRAARLKSERFKCAGPSPGQGLLCTYTSTSDTLLTKSCLGCAKSNGEVNLAGDYIDAGFSCDTCLEMFCTDCRQFIGDCDLCALSQCSNCAGERTLSSCDQCGNSCCSTCDMKEEERGYGMYICAGCKAGDDDLGADY